MSDPIIADPGSVDSLTLKGDLTLQDSRGRIRLRLDAPTGQVFIFDSRGKIIARIDDGGNLWLGGHGTDGDVVLFPTTADRHHLDQATIHLAGEPAQAWIGGKKNDGNLVVRSRDGEQKVLVGIDASTKAGQLRIKDGAGRQCIWLDGRHGNLRLGSEGRDGDLTLTDAKNRPVIHLDGGAGGESSARIYGNGRTGDLKLGGEGAHGDLFIRDRRGRTRIHLDGGEGDIVLSNADCAEEFDLLGGETIEPGTVVVLGDDGKLSNSTGPYDHRVAGVIAGAGRYKPALVLDRQERAGRGPVSLLGKVYCKVEADSAPVRVGDLLTTSSLPGHAMKVTDRSRATGSILGKALGELERGRELVPVLVTLQ